VGKGSVSVKSSVGVAERPGMQKGDDTRPVDCALRKPGQRGVWDGE